MARLNAAKINRQKTKSRAGNEISLPKTGVKPQSKTMKCNCRYLFLFSKTYFI